jgi:hypothetical protein
MISDTIRQNAIAGLRNAREELLSFRKEELTHRHLRDWNQKWSSAFSRAEGAGANIIQYNLQDFRQGHENSPYDVLYDISIRSADLLARSIEQIDASVKVVPILEDLIAKVRDAKLTQLLLEFNAGKENQPNASAILFRTILMLVIQERAKLKDPDSPYATAQDLRLETALTVAKNGDIFESAEQKLLHQFNSSGQKGRFDNAAHKPGGNSLIEKEYLTHAVELLNKILPTIV